MTYAGAADRDAIEAEQPYETRDLPTTTWEMLSRTATAHGSRKALTYQIFSDPGAKEETFTWSELQAKSAQTANLFRSLGVGESDVVAYLLPNCNETVLTYLGGQIAGIVNPPSKKKYGHYLNDDMSLDVQAWLDGATFHDGSWWPHWETWLRGRSGKKIGARKIGDKAHPPLCDAPGTYVRADLPTSG